MTLSIVILAAGQGKRMRSQLPKVLHKLAGKPLLERVITTALTLKPTQPPFIIYGYQGSQVREALKEHKVNWIEQKEQLGTGHALLQALPLIADDNQVLVLYGDVPLVSPLTLRHFIATTPQDAIGIITATVPDPTGLGRILRNPHHKIINIVEEKDTNEKERAIKEINSGIYLIPAKYLQAWLPELKNTNSQKEFYLTDIISQAVEEKILIHSMQPSHHKEICGINDRIQLAELERFYQNEMVNDLMKAGVSFADPQRFDLRGTLITGLDNYIDINVIIEGKVTLGNNCNIGPHVVLRDTIIADNVVIKANSIIEGAFIADNCVVGPFARIRPETEISPNVHIGNFVEIKKSWIGQGSKINHLSYIGDSEIGKQVNIGAGTITCNYDGVKKHKTIIKDHAFIGSNTQLIAPITIGEYATIGAGSTITRNAPANQLTLCRAKQYSVENWQRPKNKAKES